MALDTPTLFVAAICVTALLGVFLLMLWVQDRSVRALAWWAGAYLFGGFGVMLWLVQAAYSPFALWPADLASALLFVCCGMIWNGARSFHGRTCQPWGLFAGAIVWLFACSFPLASSTRLILSSAIITSYAVLTAIELSLDRRRKPHERYRVVLLPLLHGLVFLSPILTSYFYPRATVGFGASGFALFALLTLVYVVGTAFILVVMANEQSVQLHKTAAVTDPLTGLFNRRGFLEAAQQLADLQSSKGLPVTVLMFDLDHFKSINDRFGHGVGDDALRVFARVASANMRAQDIIGRLGGEEFAAILPGSAEAIVPVAERVRLAFASQAVKISGAPVNGTVSIGTATGACCVIEALLTRADAALYRAKTAGRNRVVSDEMVDADGHAPASHRNTPVFSFAPRQEQSAKQQLVA
jgi:diguanylate cyclase (GGDEF)-like protein